MTDPLHDCLLLRASDLAHYMLTRGLDVKVARGATANGHPITVVYAIGEAADKALELGERIAREMVLERERRVSKAGEN